MSQLRLAEPTRRGRSSANGVHDIPAAQDQEIARVKLATQGIRIDALTPEQKKYMDDYSAGT